MMNGDFQEGFDMGYRVGFAEGRAEALREVNEKLLTNQSNMIIAEEFGNLYRASMELHRVANGAAGTKVGY